ncbi:hypothetical protein L211DRAFT_786209 [Terfezia boudieri ATCC MYA-4762]|uniref:Serine/threonine-protein kinase TEL1 n=1 Tax=Terfezia boudieri ATCC MYA-4762 TaxID=1051890 RepID=A0A3N4LLT8_9PEZI|nr:hypothetical protein L211DRAFT_786209 [Terfezia boudieri ATCC MYA-4762]
MNYHEADAEDLAELLGISYGNLLSLGFHRIMAYCTVWAISTPPVEGAPKLPPIESRLRKRLGDAAYEKLYSKTFPRIVATLFQVMEQEGTSQKLLSRDPTLSSAKHVMDDIVKISSSEAQLGESLKPSFKVKCVLNALYHICRKGGYDEGKVWNPAIFTYVVRKLFNTIDPSLGPLHACAVIRKIRLLVCLAGKTVHEGYPLEMLIHGLRPFIVDAVCAQDTVGIVQYLFLNGRAYLETNPTFVISTFLSIMALLRTFIATAPNSQVDSSQFLGSQGTAQTFHSWLCDYLSDYRSAALSTPNAETFKAIVESAIGFRTHGNAFQGSKESELLKVLLNDQAEEDGLLDDASRRLAFSLISLEFGKPETYREDLYGADQESMNVSKALLHTSYAASGIIHPEWTREVELPKLMDLPRDQNALEITPKAAILKHLTELLFSEDRQEAGLAEITLNDILDQETAAGEEALRSELIVSMHHLRALAMTPPENLPSVESTLSTIALAGRVDGKPVNDWVKDLAIAISLNGPSDAVGSRVGPLLQSVEGLAVKGFPYLVHLVLIFEDRTEEDELRGAISDVFRLCFKQRTNASVPHMVVLINTIIYLRAQQREDEKTKLERDDWLDLDYQDLARAACLCGMFKSALMFIEIHCSREQTDYIGCTDLLLEIYKNIDEPDSYYGLNQGASLNTVLNKLEYERDGWKSLSFRGAHMDTSMRLESRHDTDASVGTVGAFNTLGLYGLSHFFLQGGFWGFGNESTLENVYESAWKLEQWDLPCPATYTGRQSLVYRALQRINNTVNAQDLSSDLDSSILEVMKQLTTGKQTGLSLGASVRTLAMLTEVEEVLTSKNSVQLQEAWRRLDVRTPWMKIANFSDVEEMMAIRQATFSSIAKRRHLQENSNIDLKVARLYQAKALISFCELARSHKVLQHALSASTHLNKIVDLCAEVALDISAATTLQTASVLWDQGEATSSIRLLQGLENANLNVIQQDISVGRTELLATLGCWISEARLEKPEVIMADYLEAAIKQLQKEKNKPEVAGRVYHEFALFCDRQLNNQGNIEDIKRAAKLRESKQAELLEAERQLRSTPKDSPKFETLSKFEAKAKKWLALDDMEYLRLRENREAFLERSIGNYLRCLGVCDDYDQDAIRFCSLWLQSSTYEKANNAVATYINRVDSRKFVPLMNQLSSRLMDQGDDFQTLLEALILRICRDHPYHSLYQILSVTKSKTKDLSSHSRATMASKIAMTLKQEDEFAGKVMTRLHQSIATYIRVASYKMKQDKKVTKIALRRAFPHDRVLDQKIEKEIPSLKLPPPTMDIPVRHDCDYSSIPYLQKFNPELAVAGGLSAPKVLTCHDSSGQSYKMLVKGGGDDLRQDAIMEQVFEHVSHLLQRNRQTRQRNLGVRTYKVLPLGVGAGIIEFVPNTIPLHEYLIPVHTKYYPKEWTANQCKQAIFSVQTKAREERINIFQKVLENYSPIMRFFFMHHFEGPDEWFRSRLAYTRSTAAISMLGWVLGLGDRHGHNILLDEKSGEVVHIDLGVAFEQGRVLPIPEVVPFRLTRDIVDGMGVTGTEGVFRRCCEFTLSVLRLEKDNIMTILDVLRYDPLYSWTISPIKLKKMQRGEGRDESEISAEDIFVKPNQGTKDDGEAERSLEIVNKKLAGTLSVGATVNELIQQATDVKNLALLFCGEYFPSILFR